MAAEGVNHPPKHANGGPTWDVTHCGFSFIKCLLMRWCQPCFLAQSTEREAWDETNLFPAGRTHKERKSLAETAVAWYLKNCDLLCCQQHTWTNVRSQHTWSSMESVPWDRGYMNVELNYTKSNILKTLKPLCNAIYAASSIDFVFHVIKIHYLWEGSSSVIGRQHYGDSLKATYAKPQLLSPSTIPQYLLLTFWWIES